jgi:hypothetical protein
VTPIFAHHVEAQHVPVLLGLIVAGFYVGWSLVARWLARKSG